jgi:hypothetical protein
VHDRQDSRVGQRIAVGSEKDQAVGMRAKSVALKRSGQHCNERSTIIELNEKSSSSSSCSSVTVSLKTSLLE